MIKNSDIVNAILDFHPYIEGYSGCDEYKFGDPGEKCRGVAVALSPSVRNIRAAAEAGCNLLIVHEPTFYQTPDYPEWRGRCANSVVKEKQELMKELGITVWRDHDHMHFHEPDCIFTGVMRELGWEQYYVKSEVPDFCFRFKLPATTVGEVAKHLSEKMGLNGLRYIGRPDDSVSNVAIVGHIIMGFGPKEGIDGEGFYNDYSMELMKKLEAEGMELIIPGETIEWTVLEYLRDAVEFGRTKACLFPGHYNLEKLGMKDFTVRIREILAAKEMNVNVVHIPDEDGFKYF